MTLSPIEKSDWKRVGWALKPSMIVLIQPMFLEHSCENVRLTVASCLSWIIALTSPLQPYNNDIMKEILLLIVETLRGLNNITLPTFQK